MYGKTFAFLSNLIIRYPIRNAINSVIKIRPFVFCPVTKASKLPPSSEIEKINNNK